MVLCGILWSYMAVYDLIWHFMAENGFFCLAVIDPNSIRHVYCEEISHSKAPRDNSLQESEIYKAGT